MRRPAWSPSSRRPITSAGRCGGNNVYDITVGASDGIVTTTKDVAISVSNVNEAPTITSAATASFAENKTGTVYTVAATDQDAGATLTYSLTGTDAARFNINATTGVITFKSTPNYEAPTDAGKNNVYDVTVRASDGTNVTTKDVAITVTNVNEAPVITSAATASFTENGTGTVYTVGATDVDAGATLTYSLAGTDASKFNIDATTGVVTFKTSPNYEAPIDSGTNNVYNVTVRASTAPSPRPRRWRSPSRMSATSIQSSRRQEPRISPRMAPARSIPPLQFRKPVKP